jgi:hypothetical protein
MPRTSPSFVPDRAVMGRFHLRCYLRTILAAVTEEPAE